MSPVFQPAPCIRHCQPVPLQSGQSIIAPGKPVMRPSPVHLGHVTVYSRHPLQLHLGPSCCQPISSLLHAVTSGARKRTRAASVRVKFHCVMARRILPVCTQPVSARFFHRGRRGEAVLWAVVPVTLEAHPAKCNICTGEGPSHALFVLAASLEGVVCLTV